jgi:hypothetical protein
MESVSMSEVDEKAGRGAGVRGELLGHVDNVSKTTIEGWAVDKGFPDSAVALRFLDNGTVIGQMLANRPRPGLKEAGIGNGRNAFVFIIPGGLSPVRAHVIEVQRVADGAPVPNSPWTVEAAIRKD